MSSCRTILFVFILYEKLYVIQDHAELRFQSSDSWSLRRCPGVLCLQLKEADLSRKESLATSDLAYKSLGIKFQLRFDFTCTLQSSSLGTTEMKKLRTCHNVAKCSAIARLTQCQS